MQSTLGSVLAFLDDALLESNFYELELWGSSTR